MSAVAPVEVPEHPVVEEDAARGALPCGTSVVYWSASCGPILSAASRNCSAGGTLMNPLSSCTSHFASWSRGCGLLFLGCQSACKRASLPCRPGTVSFLSPFHRAASGASVVELIVVRRGGLDGVATAAITLSSSSRLNESSISPSLISFPNQVDTPAVIRVRMQSVLQSVTLLLKLVGNNSASLGQFPSATVEVRCSGPVCNTCTLHRHQVNPPPAVAFFEQEYYVVNAGSALQVHCQWHVTAHFLDTHNRSTLCAKHTGWTRLGHN